MIVTINIQPPYLLLIGETTDNNDAKTAKGIVDWCPDKVAGQHRLPGCSIDLGVPDLSIAEALDHGAKSLVIGCTPVGGQLPDSWTGTICSAIENGLDIVSGLHTRLKSVRRFVELASQYDVNLIDVRDPPPKLPVGSGTKRNGRRLLMVGTDCAVGKKYSALALTRAFEHEGYNSTFRATGQTGIMIAGGGVPIDAVIADFISGAAETVSPENDSDHWDVIEGQGSLFNPGYAGVSLGLLHGSQPDALVICHAAGRTEIEGWPGFPIPDIKACIDANVAAAKLTNDQVTVVGISVNTSGLSEKAARRYKQQMRDDVNLPVIDPLVDGCSPKVQEIERKFGKQLA